MQTVKCIWIPNVHVPVISMHQPVHQLPAMHLYSVGFFPKEWIAAKIHRECVKWMKKIELYLESKAS